MEALPSLRLAIRWGVGYEQMDVAAATELGVAIANAPGYGTDDVAEMAFALLMTVARRTAEHHAADARRRLAGVDASDVHRLRGRTLGLIGTGRIGSSVAGIAAGFGLRVVGHDLVRTPPGAGGCGYRGRGHGHAAGGLGLRLAACALHPGHPPPGRCGIAREAQAGRHPRQYRARQGRGYRRRSSMPSPAATSRAPGLDVFEQEPLPADSPLRTAPNVVLTPHVAGYSVEAFADLRREMCRTTIDFMTTGWASPSSTPRSGTTCAAEAGLGCAPRGAWPGRVWPCRRSTNPAVDRYVGVTHGSAGDASGRRTAGRVAGARGCRSSVDRYLGIGRST